jgi:ubiquinone/menaquinone biosynthesis C-methylase UbiE
MKMSRSGEPRYIPALSFGWLTPLYDSVLRWGMREQFFKQRLIVRANIQAGQRVLDLGCGTGTLTLMIKRLAPQAEIIGLDGDWEVLSIAAAKSGKADVHIRWDQGVAYALPYPDASFDTVVSSLVIHHLASADKIRAFQDVRRVLRPGGTFHIVDFGRPFNVLTRLQAVIMRPLEHAAENFDGRLVEMLQAAGFDSASETKAMNTVFGPLWFYKAQS